MAPTVPRSVATPTAQPQGAAPQAPGGLAPALAVALGASACAAARRQAKGGRTAVRVVDDFEDVCEQTGITLSRASARGAGDVSTARLLH